MTSLDLALIGNSSVAALIDANGTIVWSCLPRFDSDAVFCALLRDGRGADDYGFFEIELADFARAEQAYIAHTGAAWRSRISPRDSSSSAGCFVP